MKIASLFAAAALVAGAGPAFAQSGEINHHVRVGHALRQGCAVQHVHTPAGKMVHAAPIVRCGAESRVAARNGSGNRQAASQAAGGIVGVGSR